MPSNNKNPPQKVLFFSQPTRSFFFATFTMAEAAAATTTTTTTTITFNPNAIPVHCLRCKKEFIMSIDDFDIYSPFYCKTCHGEDCPSTKIPDEEVDAKLIAEGIICPSEASELFLKFSNLISDYRELAQRAARFLAMGSKEKEEIKQLKEALAEERQTSARYRKKLLRAEARIMQLESFLDEMDGFARFKRYLSNGR